MHIGLEMNIKWVSVIRIHLPVHCSRRFYVFTLRKHHSSVFCVDALRFMMYAKCTRDMHFAYKEIYVILHCIVETQAFYATFLKCSNVNVLNAKLMKLFSIGIAKFIVIWEFYRYLRLCCSGGYPRRVPKHYNKTPESIIHRKFVLPSISVRFYWKYAQY